MAVLFNGRTAVHVGSDGTLTTQDDCYTGPERQVVTYQNIAKSKDAANTAKTVFINGHPVCHKESYFSKSYGSEAGDGGGVKSGTICGKAEFVTSSSNVFIEGIPAVRQGDLMVSNNRNTPPAPLQQKGVPFSGDQDKINKFPKMPYPKLEFDLSDLAPGLLPKEILQIVRKSNRLYATYMTFSLTGSLMLQKEGMQNPLTLNLHGYEIEAKQTLGDFTNALTLSIFNKNEIAISCSITSQSWTASITPEPLGFKAEANPQPVSTLYKEWSIMGTLGFECEVKYEPLIPTYDLVPLEELINEHSRQIIGTCIGILFALSIRAIGCLVAAA